MNINKITETFYMMFINLLGIIVVLGFFLLVGMFAWAIIEQKGIFHPSLRSTNVSVDVGAKVECPCCGKTKEC